MGYEAITIEGVILSVEIMDTLGSIACQGQSPGDFGFSGKVRDEIAFAWADAKNHWAIFRRHIEKTDTTDPKGTTRTRKYWTVPLLEFLGYTPEYSPKAMVAGEKTYNISHRGKTRAQMPLHMEGWFTDLDRPMEKNRQSFSPHALVQEYLNLTEDHLYGLVTNGKTLRLLREAGRLIRLSYIEFDLERMMEEDLFGEFAVMFRLIHASRMAETPEDPSACIMESYHLNALKEGERIREGLSGAVEECIRLLARGFLSFPGNSLLIEKIEGGEITPRSFSHHLLFLVYRLLFLLVIEERQLVFPGDADKKLKEIYFSWYSVTRLRQRTERKKPDERRFCDLWQGLGMMFRLFEHENDGKALGIQPLRGDLFGPAALGILPRCGLANSFLAQCMRQLNLFWDPETKAWRRVNYGSLNVEEFGSVYEGMLEYEPVFRKEKGVRTFDFIKGDERSKTGTHFTPEELTQPLIRHSLEYIIRDKLAAAGDKAAALLSIRICDPACGSGHILLSAARRLGLELARVRTGHEQPPPPEIRRGVREVIGHCIYGVDKNPQAVELCKVALWLEGHSPGQPLTFLDHHIKCGDSLVGTAEGAGLLSGIPDRAFKKLAGDDTTAAAMKKRNKKERNETGQQTLGEHDHLRGTTIDLGSIMESIDAMAETTPEETELKKEHYEAFCSGAQRQHLKILADIQTAQFFVPKTKATEPSLCTQATFHSFLQGRVNAAETPQGEQARVQAQKHRFFHWFLEFPEVFCHGGFDCILGNPPFLGGQHLSGNYGITYPAWLKAAFPPAGSMDLAGFFFRRAYSLLKEDGFFAFISTNTIAQGTTREGSLDVITKDNGTIVFAVRSTPWPGRAAVSVALAAIKKGQFKGQQILDNKEVSYISPYFDDLQLKGNPMTLVRNSGKSFQGSIILGDGFILTPRAAQELYETDAKYKDVILPYLNGDDLNSSPDSSPSRYVINFFDWPLEKAKQYEVCYKIIEDKVKPIRDKITYSKNAKKNWWLYERYRPELYSIIAPLERVLVVAQTSKTLAFCFIPIGIVFSMMCIVFNFERYYQFMCLQNSIYTEWAWKYCSTMKSDLRYTPSSIFENFPFPPGISLDKRNGDALSPAEQVLEDIGREYYEHRKGIMLKVQLGLTALYNQFHNPALGEIAGEPEIKDVEKTYGKQTAILWKHFLKPENNPACSFNEAVREILELREKQRRMDLAVAAAYGWEDLSPGHGFYEVDYLPENDRVRYTISPGARKEVLTRLHGLNRACHEEEVAAGLVDEKGKVVKKGKRKKKDDDGYYEGTLL